MASGRDVPNRKEPTACRRWAELNDLPPGRQPLCSAKSALSRPLPLFTANDCRAGRKPGSAHPFQTIQFSTKRAPFLMQASPRRERDSIFPGAPFPGAPFSGASAQSQQRQEDAPDQQVRACSSSNLSCDRFENTLRAWPAPSPHWRLAAATAPAPTSQPYEPRSSRHAPSRSAGVSPSRRLYQPESAGQR
jgi:hypothetical protein